MNDVVDLTAKILFIIWSFGLQIPVCMYLGYLTAKKTGRSVLNWLVMGFIIAVIPPPMSIIISLVAYFFYPPAMPKRGHPTRDVDEKPPDKPKLPPGFGLGGPGS